MGLLIIDSLSLSTLSHSESLTYREPLVVGRHGRDGGAVVCVSNYAVLYGSAGQRNEDGQHLAVRKILKLAPVSNGLGETEGRFFIAIWF